MALRIEIVHAGPSPEVGDNSDLDILRYYRAVYRLQDMAGLSFREARAVLAPLEDDTAEEMGITFDEFFATMIVGDEKVKRSGYRLEDIVPLEILTRIRTLPPSFWTSSNHG